MLGKPDNDHGIHCAGIIAANTDNGLGVAGIAGGLSPDGGITSGRGVSIMTSVGFGKSRNGKFAEALVYGADNGAHISSNSWTYGRENAFSNSVKKAIDYASEAGVLIVFAAGNHGVDGNYYPPRYDKVMAVSAISSKTQRATGFTNYGEWVDICAPGNGIWSLTLKNDADDQEYRRMSGTSMAAPHVAAVLALGKVLYPAVTNQNMTDCLYDTAINVDGSQDHEHYKGMLGAGLVNALEYLYCIDEIKSNDLPPTTRPSALPTQAPSTLPTQAPTTLPSGLPSHVPSLRPSASSTEPSMGPSSQPSSSTQPSEGPSSLFPNQSTDLSQPPFPAISTAGGDGSENSTTNNNAGDFIPADASSLTASSATSFRKIHKHSYLNTWRIVSVGMISTMFFFL